MNAYANLDTTRNQVLEGLRKGRDTFVEMSRQLTWVENDLTFAVRYFPDRSFAEEHLRRLHEKAVEFTKFSGALLARIEAERPEEAA